MRNVPFHAVLEEKIQENINHPHICEKANEALIFGGLLRLAEITIG
jgi:hypothetical protein